MLVLARWILPLSLILGVTSGFYFQWRPSALLFSFLICAGCGFIYISASRWPAPSLALACLLGALLGNQVSGDFLRKAEAYLPTQAHLGKAYRIQARVLYQWETRFGSAIKVDRIRVLSPDRVDFSLKKLTLYTPTLERIPQRHARMTAWIRLGRDWEPRPIPWPMQGLRERYMPRFHGSIKDLRLLKIGKSVSGNDSALSMGNRELVALFTKGIPSFTWSRRLEPFGLGHLLAISGLHCLVVYLLLQLALFPIRSPIWRALLTTLGLLGFAHWMGWSVSVTRAAWMLVFWSWLPFWNRPRSWLRLWCGLLLIGMLSDPLVLLQAGFWYSFGASLGLILGGRQAPASPLRHPWLRVARPFLPIVSAQLFVIPIHLLFGCSSTFTSLFWNLLGFAVLWLLLGLMSLSLLSLIWAPIASLANGCEKALLFVIEHIRVGDGALEWVRFPHQPLVVLAVLTLLALALLHGRSELRWYGALAVLGLFSLFNRPLTGERLVMLDAGQGLCMLHVSESGTGTLFDAGGELPVRQRFRHLLRLYGARQTPTAFLSHANRDHFNFLEEPLPDLTIFSSPEALPALRAIPSLQAYPFRGLSGGQRIRLEGMEIDVLWPLPDLEAPNSNEASLVLTIRGRGWSVLFTGDAGRWMERRLPEPNGLDGSVLQVGHHGSRSATGASFLARWAPAAALISCGRGNRFGHPYPGVLDNLERAGVPILITAERGSITILSRGRLRLEGVVPESRSPESESVLRRGKTIPPSPDR